MDISLQKLMVVSLRYEFRQLCGGREQRAISISLTDVKKKPRHNAQRGRNLEFTSRPDYLLKSR